MSKARTKKVGGGAVGGASPPRPTPPPPAQPPREMPRARRAAVVPLLVAAALTIATLLGMAVFQFAASAYLVRLPENWRERMAGAAADGDFEAVVSAFDAEVAVRPYNFAVYYGLAETALTHDDEALRDAALATLFRAYRAHEATVGRAVFTRGWSEGRVLRLIGRLLARAGRAEMAAMAWQAAFEADPFRTRAEHAAWARRDAELAARVGRVQTTSYRIPAAAADGVPPAPSADEDATLVFAPDFTTGSTWDDTRVNVLSESGGAAAFQVHRRGTISLDPRGARSLVLVAALRGRAAFGGWPYVLVEAVTDEGTAAEESRPLGLLRIDTAGWATFRVPLLDAVRAGERLRLAYVSEVYDAAVRQDRDYFIGWIALGGKAPTEPRP